MTEPAALKIPPCPRKCGDCKDCLHHWIEAFVDPDEPDGETELAIVADWLKWRTEDPEAPVSPIAWTCKHCDFWMRHYDNCPGCEGPVDAQGVCVTMCGEVEDLEDGSEFDIPVSGDDADSDDGYYADDDYFNEEDVP